LFGRSRTIHHGSGVVIGFCLGRLPN
jgi:hypothetical protein